MHHPLLAVQAVKVGGTKLHGDKAESCNAHISIHVLFVVSRYPEVVVNSVFARVNVHYDTFLPLPTVD